MENRLRRRHARRSASTPRSPIADKVFPDGRLHWIFLPSGAGRRLCRRQTVGRRAQPDQDLPQCRRRPIQRPRSAGAGPGRFLRRRECSWNGCFRCIAARRSARIGRPFMLLSRLAPLVLFTTGFLRWRQKRRARRRRPELIHCPTRDRHFDLVFRALCPRRRRAREYICPMRATASPRSRSRRGAAWTARS